MRSATLRTTPIVDAILPGSGILRDALLIGAGTGLTIAGAYVSIPWQPVPFTLQTLAVMLCGLTLGIRRGALSQLLYVGLGISGAPIFAQSKSGIGVIGGTTGGYLISFAIVAALLGWLADRGWTRSVWKTAASMAIGSTINLGLGAIWLSYFIGGRDAWIHGAAVFIVPEIMKAIVVIVALPGAWKLLGSKP
jgi:biotin transport system substrate-specific component